MIGRKAGCAAVQRAGLSNKGMREEGDVQGRKKAGTEYAIE